MRPEDLLYAMLEIPSLSGEEQRLAQFLSARMLELGFRVHSDETGNVIGDIGSGDPVIMLLSHLDTVGPVLPTRRDRERLHGRGAVDAKGPLATMICAAAQRPGFPGTIRVIGAVEEERLSRGGHHIAATLPPPDALIIGEPGGWDRVVLGYKGKIDLEFWVERPSAHSTKPVPKASELAVAFWHRVLDVLGPDCDHGSFYRPAATLRHISGDLVTGRVEVDCRVPPGFAVDDFMDRLRKVTGDGEVKLIRSIPAVRVERCDPVAVCLSAAIRSHGGQPRPTLKTGTSDMNTVSQTWTVPMAAYGPGNGALDHSDDEHIRIDEFRRGITILGTAIDELQARLRPRSDARFPEGSAPEGSAPEGSAPEGSAPEGSAPEGSAPEGSASKGSAPGGTGRDADARSRETA
jgi:LysW-gamma-L-lysine carboxypeptidase